jgi:hypothetical protein
MGYESYVVYLLSKSYLCAKLQRYKERNTEHSKPYYWFIWLHIFTRVVHKHQTEEVFLHDELIRMWKEESVGSETEGKHGKFSVRGISDREVDLGLPEYRKRLLTSTLRG